MPKVLALIIRTKRKVRISALFLTAIIFKFIESYTGEKFKKVILKIKTEAF